MRRTAWLLSALCLVLSAPFAACGGGGGSGGSGGGPPPIDDECDKAADCLGGTCDALTATYEVCAEPIPAEVTMCEPLTTSVCCSSADCTNGGACFDVPVCSGIAASQHECVLDACDEQTPCAAGSVCAPAGLGGWPARRCLPAACASDADCTAAASGTCALVRLGCCALDLQVACVYPGGCVRDGDCDGTEHCEVDASGRAACAAGPVQCPA